MEIDLARLSGVWYCSHSRSAVNLLILSIVFYFIRTYVLSVNTGSSLQAKESVSTRICFAGEMMILIPVLLNTTFHRYCYFASVSNLISSFLPILAIVFVLILAFFFIPP